MVSIEKDFIILKEGQKIPTKGRITAHKNEGIQTESAQPAEPLDTFLLIFN
jgi:hypothetical protein